VKLASKDELISEMAAYNTQLAERAFDVIEVQKKSHDSSLAAIFGLTVFMKESQNFTTFLGFISSLL